MIALAVFQGLEKPAADFPRLLPSAGREGGQAIIGRLSLCFMFMSLSLLTSAPSTIDHRPSTIDHGPWTIALYSTSLTRKCRHPSVSPSITVTEVSGPVAVITS